MSNRPTTNHSDKPPTEPVVVEVFPYDPRRGVTSTWDDDTVLRVEVSEATPRTIVISGECGRADLPRTASAHPRSSQHADRAHLDFDDYCGWFEEGSFGVRIERE